MVIKLREQEELCRRLYIRGYQAKVQRKVERAILHSKLYVRLSWDKITAHIGIQEDCF